MPNSLYDYVNHPYEQVRGALSKDPPAVFQSATKAAASSTQSIASELRIDIGGIWIEADIRVSVKNIEVKNRAAMSRPATRLQLEWEAARMPRLFPNPLATGSHWLRTRGSPAPASRQCTPGSGSDSCRCSPSCVPWARAAKVRCVPAHPPCNTCFFPRSPGLTCSPGSTCSRLAIFNKAWILTYGVERRALEATA